MKAISIREPYASMFRDLKKTIETRTWKTNYRGKMLLCCSKTPSSPIAGKAFAIGNLVDCRPMKREDEAKACCKIYPNAHSWIFDDIKIISPFPVKGQLGIFEVEF